MTPEQFQYFLSINNQGTRLEILEYICNRQRQDIEHLRKYETEVSRLHKLEVTLTSQRDVALKEAERDKEVMKDLRTDVEKLKKEVAALKNQLDGEYVKRRKLRSSFNELGRILNQEALDQAKSVLETMKEGLMG